MKNNIRALCIVAHPDDETIWMGGTLLKNKKWKWDIVSLCRKNDSDRAPKFKKVCEFYNARGIISDLDDEKLEPLSTEEVAEKIKQILPKKKYNYIFTHGSNGEYGHIRHKEVHNAINHLIKNKDLDADFIYYFDYIPGKSFAPHDQKLKIPVPRENSDMHTSLDNSDYENKIKLITELYGFKQNTFEVLSCNRGESFYLQK